MNFFYVRPKFHKSNIVIVIVISSRNRNDDFASLDSNNIIILRVHFHRE